MAPRVLIIAGTDSSGGAGVAADLWAVGAMGAEASVVVTTVTAQNALGVQGCWPVPVEGIVAQLDAVGTVDAVKIGMLGTRAAVEHVAAWVDRSSLPVVVDPVLSASAGGSLLEEEAREALLALLAGVTLVTPNLLEYAALGGESWLADHPGAVLVKGGHGSGTQLVDRLLGSGAPLRWAHDRRPGVHRGTGCRLSSAIASRLAHGDSLPQAVDASIAWLQSEICASAARSGE